jgi:hypothetical protein
VKRRRRIDQLARKRVQKSADGVRSVGGAGKREVDKKLIDNESSRAIDIGG